MRRTNCSNSPGAWAKPFCFSRTSPRIIGGAVTASAPRSRPAPKLFSADGERRAHELPPPSRDDRRHGTARRAAGSHLFEFRAKRAPRTTRLHHRAVVDDQLALNEVLHTRYYDQLRILPCQYNYRCYLGMTKKGWPTVTHLDGVMIYHNGFCIEAAKRLLPVRPKANLPPLAPDARPLTRNEQLWRRLKQRLRAHIIE